MRIAVICDGRAEHARRWMRHFIEHGDEVMLLATQPWHVPLQGVQYHALPGVFRTGRAFMKSSEQSEKPPSKLASLLIRSGMDALIRPIWQQLNALDVLPQGRAARRLLRGFRPDVIQVFRIQNEGYVAAYANCHPWVLSVWGQDINYYAQKYFIHRLLTKWALRKPDALTSDCYRDIRLSQQWGLPETAPTRYVPGNGGVDLGNYPLGLPARQREKSVVYARGFGPYLRFENMLRAIKRLQVQGKFRNAKVILIAPPAQIPRFRRQLADLEIADEAADLVPFSTQQEWSGLLQRVAALISPSVSDGTPNGMLEAMACGAFPLMGNIESIREWIDHGRNGLLFDPDDPAAIAACIEQALEDEGLRERAQSINRQVIEQRADYARNMPQVREFYQEVRVRFDRQRSNSV